MNKRFHVQLHTATGVIGIAHCAFNEIEHAYIRMDELELSLRQKDLTDSKVVVYDTVDNVVICSVLLKDIA